MKKIIVFSGAGTSAESGLKTFRDSDGLWEEYNIEDVATPEAWARDPSLVLDFYNMRRRQVLQAAPNEAHLAIAKLEERFDVQVITQNIDDLHERAGSTNVMHLHGEILKARGEQFPDPLYHIDQDLKVGDVCSNGSQLRPHVVWFGEPVPMMSKALHHFKRAELVIIVGTSLNVYPAAGLVHSAPPQANVFLIDPKPNNETTIRNLEVIRSKASMGVPQLVDHLMSHVGA